MIRLYNTLTRKKEELTEKRIGMYVCGPTVYDEPHIGHARSAYIFDIIVKYMRYRGYKVTFVRNVTDIDDKIIDKAKEQQNQVELKDRVKHIARFYLKRYHEDMDLLGLDKPDIEPKATDVISDMIRFIKVLIRKGFAYRVLGDVYFDVRKFKDYGLLSGQGIDEMEEGARVAVDKNKKDPLDFALWKSAKEDEPSWDSPWGKGRPGWHIECSVMSTKYLKNNFVIHGGGLDLIFPHHENEIAQTVSAGKKSARYWIHNGLLTIKDKKMSKSLGNFISIKDFKDRFKDLDLLKLLFLSSHYRHPVDYTEEKIREMQRAKERITIFYNSIKNQKLKIKNQKSKVESHKIEILEKKFIEAMDDDLNTSLAMSCIFELVNEGNSSVSNGEIEKAKKIRDKIDKFAALFGLEFEQFEAELEPEVEELIQDRNDARKNKDFRKSDEIRRELLEKGIVLEDTKEGTVWRKKI